MELARLSIKKLLQTHAGIINELKQRGVVRTQNNPVGDYAEWLVSKGLGLKLAGNSETGYDATGADGATYQIKARRVTSNSSSRQLSPIRNLDKQHFDFLAGLVFDEDYNVSVAILLPHDIICEYATYRPHVNGHILHLKGAVLEDSRTINIMHKLIT